MRSQINKIQSSLSASLQIVADNAVIATVERKNFCFAGAFCLYVNNKLKYKLVNRISKQFKNWFRKFDDKIFIVYEIQDAQKQVIGSICQKGAVGFTYIGYGYFELKMNDATYKMYGIGLGKGLGYKFPIYQGDSQVALIEKDNVVYNNLDTYRVFALNEQINEIACLFGLYIDTLLFAHCGEVTFTGVKTDWELTKDENLTKKYDPNFISRNGL